MRHPEYRHELESLDPITLLVVPLALVLLALLIIRAIGVAAIV